MSKLFCLKRFNLHIDFLILVLNKNYICCPNKNEKIWLYANILENNQEGPRAKREFDCRVCWFRWTEEANRLEHKSNLFVYYELRVVYSSISPWRSIVWKCSPTTPHSTLDLVFCFLLMVFTLGLQSKMLFCLHHRNIEHRVV